MRDCLSLKDGIDRLYRNAYCGLRTNLHWMRLSCYLQFLGKDEFYKSLQEFTCIYCHRRLAFILTQTFKFSETSCEPHSGCQIKCRRRNPNQPRNWMQIEGPSCSNHCSAKYTHTHPTATTVNGTAVPLQAWTGPEVSRRFRIPDFKTIGTWRWEGCKPYAQTAFTPRKYSWYSFLLEAESTPGP